jgi:hypothetical protein
VRYNCTIIDLYDRSVIATVNGAHITTELALRALLIAVKRHKPAKGLILHSDQGSQFTSKEFVRSCEALFIQQSMSRTGCPYDNAPIERYFNTLKHEQIYLFEYRTEREWDAAVAEFAYAWYNQVRPVSGKYFWINWGCGRFFGLDYAARPRLRRYSIGLIASKDILIRSSLYQRRKPSSSYMNSSRETPSQDLV